MSTVQRTKPPSALIAGVIILAVGVGLIGINAYYICGGASSKSWPSATGTVKSSKVKRISRVGKPDRYQATISYTYEVDSKPYSSSRVKYGEDLVTREDANSVVSKYPRGSEVKVYYKPDDPNEAVLETVITFNFSGLFFSPFILLLGLYLLRSGSKQLRGVSLSIT